jgi:membrane-associated phospholipid phosphatase
MTLLVDPHEQVEKGRAALRTSADRFAHWLSQITSPFVVGLAVLGSISLSTAATVIEGLQWFAIIGVGLLVPFGVIWWGVKKGALTDVQVSRRSQRLIPLFVVLISLCGMLAGLLVLSASRPLVATLVAVIVEFAFATLITQVAKYKISLHVDSAAGAVLVSCLLVGPVFLALVPLVVLIAWARWKLEAHTLLQSICGAALGVVVTITTFRLFGLL